MSLIELLIAMTIGLFLIGGVYQLFASTRHSMMFLEAESRMQEDARYAFSFIASKLRQAGDFGCQVVTNETVTSLLDNGTDNTFRPWRIIEGWEASGTGLNSTFSAELNDTVIDSNGHSHWSTNSGALLDSGTRAKRRSDVLKIWYTSTQKTELTSISPGAITFPAIDLKQGNILVINDCSLIKVVQVCACDKDDTNHCEGDDTRADFVSCTAKSNNDETVPANLDPLPDLSDINIDTAEVRLLEEAIFFVGKRSNDRNNQPSLYWRNLGKNARPGNKEEILEGVESIQVIYGQDTDGDKTANYYVSADSVTSWDNITSIRISLLLVSKKNILSETSSVTFNNNPITVAANDRHMRKVFTTTIALRNRVTGL